MKCDMTIPGEERGDGWRKWKCARCGRKTGFTPHGPERIRFDGCQGAPHWHELGHWLAIFLEAFGITEARYLAVKSAVGLNASCGCHKREQAANSLGLRFATWLRSKLTPTPPA